MEDPCSTEEHASGCSHWLLVTEGILILWEMTLASRQVEFVLVLTNRIAKMPIANAPVMISWGPGDTLGSLR